MNRVKLLLKLADTFRRALDYQKDPNPNHWGTAHGAHIHKDKNGNVDGGAGGALNGTHIKEPTENANNGGQSQKTDYNKNEEKAIPKKKLSPSGENHISVRGFGSPDDLKRHIVKHLNKEKVFAGLSVDEYIAEGLKLLESSVGNGIEGHMDSLGNIIRYDRARNLLAAGDDGGLFTFYSPKKGHEKYLNLRREALKHGGTK